MAFLEIILLLFLFFEVYYFLRFFIVVGYLKLMKWKSQESKSPFDEGVVYGACTTTDLDFLCHMSNSRYLRELDFGRVIFVVRNGVYTKLKEAGGDMALAAITIRYRRSVTLFQVFKIRTKIVSWDDRNIYLEQRMETIHDKFIRAIAYVKVVLVNYPSVDQLFQEVGYPQDCRPTPPPELRSWIDFNDMSSKSLQKERVITDRNPESNKTETVTEGDTCKRD